MVSQCRGDLGTVLDLLARSSAKLVSGSMRNVSRGAQIRMFWLALARQTSTQTISTAAAQWLVQAALQYHAILAQAPSQAPSGVSIDGSLAEQLASLHLTAHDEGVWVKILSCEGRREETSEPGLSTAGPAFAAAAVTAIAALSGAADSAQRMTASQCALMLLQPPRDHISQHTTQPEQVPPEALKACIPHRDPLSHSLSAPAAAVLDDSALVQLGHTAVKGLSDVSTEVAASWRRVLDVIAPRITRIAGNASTTSLTAFLLLHKVRQQLHKPGNRINCVQSGT